MTDEQEAEFLRLVGMGAFPAVVARSLGLTPQAFSMRKKRDPKFREAVEQAEARAEIVLMQALIVAGKKDWRAILAILERRYKERWSRPEVQAQLGMVATKPEDVVAGITAFIAGIGKKHADFDQPDVDAEEGLAT